MGTIKKYLRQRFNLNNEMKLSTTVLALAIAATESKTAKKNKAAKTKKHKGLGRKTESNNKVKTTPIECDLAFAQANADFGSVLSWQSQDGGYSGYIDAHNYPNNLNCYVNILANPVDCKNIRATVVHAGIESANTDQVCAWDWFNFNDETTRRCGCSGGTVTGTGCLDSMFDDYQEFQEYPEYYYTMDYYGYDDYGNHGSTLLPGNSFTFNMHSDTNWAGGNVRIEWECTNDDLPTTAAPQCTYTKQSGMPPAEVLYETIYTALETAVTDDVKHNYSRVPGKETKNGTSQRTRQFLRIFSKPVKQLLHNANKCVINKGLSDLDEFTLSKDILGQDCALDLSNIDSICENLKSFLLWAYEDCQDAPFYQRRTKLIEHRCNRIQKGIAQRIHRFIRN